MEKNLIIDISDSHNHPEKKYDVSLSIMKHKIKDTIEKIKLFRVYNDDIFVDGSFFIALKFSYQIFIIRTYTKELDNKLNKLEHLPYYDYQRKIRGIWKIKKRPINKANKISVLIERYKNIETKLIDTKCDRNNTINLWFDCLTNLNNII
ncbi:hypothetical protein H8356DRAFT_1326317 [Neocallimastix lanati (nom. inval.)]|nr:hypothetical protein H8356DRAFT_1326317 [Neocallimastix sp. JGI-2020a]